MASTLLLVLCGLGFFRLIRLKRGWGLFMEIFQRINFFSLIFLLVWYDFGRMALLMVLILNGLVRSVITAILNLKNLTIAIRFIYLVALLLVFWGVIWEAKELSICQLNETFIKTDFDSFLGIGLWGITT